MPRPRRNKVPGSRLAERLRILIRRRPARALPSDDRRMFLTLFGGLGACMLLVIAVGSWAPAAAGALPRAWPRKAILDAIRMVESSDRDDVPDGDGGRAIGPYQIHQEYWQDALRAEPALGGAWQDCRRRSYAERVVDAYMSKYQPRAWEAGHAEVIARTHNGGPKGDENPATDAYWRRVLRALEQPR